MCPNTHVHACSSEDKQMTATAPKVVVKKVSKPKEASNLEKGSFAGIAHAYIRYVCVCTLLVCMCACACVLYVCVFCVCR